MGMGLVKIAALLKKAIDLTNDVNVPKTKFSEEEQVALKQKIDVLLYPRWLEAPDELKPEIAQQIQELIAPYFFHLAMKLFMYNPGLNVALDTGNKDLIGSDEAYKNTSHYNAEEAASKATMQTVSKIPDYLQEFDGRGSLTGFLTMKYKGPKGSIQGFLGPALQQQKNRDSLGNLSLDDQMPVSNKFEDYTNMQVGAGEASRGNSETFGERDLSQGMDHVQQIVNAPTQYVSYLDSLIDQQAKFIARKQNTLSSQENQNTLLSRIDQYVAVIKEQLQQPNPMQNKVLLNSVEKLNSIINNYNFMTPVKFPEVDLINELYTDPYKFTQVLTQVVGQFKAVSARDVDKMLLVTKAAKEAMPHLYALSQQLDFDNPGEKEQQFIQGVTHLEKLGEFGEKHAVKGQSSDLHNELLPHLFAAGGYGKAGLGENLELLPEQIRRNISPEDYQAIMNQDYANVSVNGKWSLMLAKTSMDASLSKFTAEDPSKARQNFIAQLDSNISSSDFILPEEKSQLTAKAHELSSSNIDTLKSFGYFAPAMAATRKLKNEKGVNYSDLSPEEVQQYLKEQLYATPGHRGLGAMSGIEYKPNNKVKSGWQYDPTMVELNSEDVGNVDTWTHDFAHNLSRSQTGGNTGIKPYTMFDNRYKHKKNLSEDRLQKMLAKFQQAQNAGAVSPHHKRQMFDTVGTPEPPTTASRLGRQIIASVKELQMKSTIFDLCGYGQIASAIDGILAEIY